MRFFELRKNKDDKYFVYLYFLLIIDNVVFINLLKNI